MRCNRWQQCITELFYLCFGPRQIAQGGQMLYQGFWREIQLQNGDQSGQGHLIDSKGSLHGVLLDQSDGLSRADN